MMTIHMKGSIVAGTMMAAAILVSLPTCTHDPVGIEGIDSLCFSSTVLPVLQTSCGMAGCHESGTGNNGFDPAGYETVVQYVDPGNPKRSSLYKVITDISGENMMPPGQPLTKNQRMFIELWILQGAHNIRCGSDTGGGGGGVLKNDSVCFVQKILPLIVSNCAMASCHDGLSQGEESLGALNSYATIRQQVVPFAPQSSSIYLAVTGSGEDPMPPYPKSPLTTAQKTMLRKWINEGALNSDCPDANCDTTGTVGYTSQVKPLIENYCISCHNASISSGGVNLNSYAQVKTYASTLRNGIPVIVGALRHYSGFKAMPPSISLDLCSIRKVELWIQQGMLDN